MPVHLSKVGAGMGCGRSPAPGAGVEGGTRRRTNSVKGCRPMTTRARTPCRHPPRIGSKDASRCGGDELGCRGIVIKAVPGTSDTCQSCALLGASAFAGAVALFAQFR